MQSALAAARDKSFGATEILICTADGKAKPVRLERGRVAIGRSSSCELSYPDDTGLSRQHVAFERTGEDWIVRDLGSKNGTLVNGARLMAPHRLLPGDRITAGHLLIVFDEPGATAADRVVFVETPETDSPTSSTVVTSLERVLGGQAGGAESVSSGSSRVRALIRAGRELAGHRPLPELFRFILDLAVEAVQAKRGLVMTLEGDRLIARAARGESFRISTAVKKRVLEQKASVLVKDAQQDEHFRSRASIVEQQVRSMMAVPLQTDDRVIGLVYVDSPGFICDFTKEDLNLLTVMANVAAIRLEHARLAEVEQAERLLVRELERAAEIQRQFLPRGAPSLPGIDLAGHNAPCRTVGGDYFEFIPYSDGKVAMVLGDVSGKGMPAALLMANLQAKVQVLADERSDLCALMRRLNRIVKASCPSNCFVTLFFCVLDSHTGELTYCNAGHNPPFLVRANGDVELIENGGIILGFQPEATYEQHQTRLEPGDVFVIYSDGVNEATDAAGEEYGEQRLAAVLREQRSEPAQAIISAVLRSVADFIADAPPADDLTLVVARRTGCA